MFSSFKHKKECFLLLNSLSWISSCSYSCRCPRSTSVAPSLFLRALSSRSSLLFDFSASRSSLVRLFTAGKRLRHPHTQHLRHPSQNCLQQNINKSKRWRRTCPVTCLSLPAPWRCPPERTRRRRPVWISWRRTGRRLVEEHPGDEPLGGERTHEEQLMRQHEAAFKQTHGLKKVKTTTI